ncbi:MAG: ATP-dependent Clp protease ATP-binding subunit [Clostridia bacterium]|nr:ATP-dependent Clp protease ATP-binding subunit [Clostridia bacterium]
MGKRFTEKAERALNGSIRIAEDYGHTYIGTEHILLSLLEEDFSSASFILRKNGATRERIKSAIKEYSGTGAKSSLTPKDMTPRCRRILEAAYDSAGRHSGGIIGTEHILLALVEERDSVAIKLLRSIGADLGSIKDELYTILKVKESKSEKTDKTHGAAIKQYGRNMTELARAGSFDPVIGRDRETERVIRVLARKNKNNPCLIGEAGVGKTAIVEGLAMRIAEGRVPEVLRGKEIISVDLTSMVAGAKYRGDFEERIKGIINDAARSKSAILFIDEVHTIVGAGSAEGAIDAANILKPQLSRADIQIIGATTYSEYHKYIEKDPALERRFQPISVNEPTPEETEKMLLGVRERYERHHGVKITDEAVSAAVALSVRYISDRFLPDKAIDILDEAAALVASKKASDTNKNEYSEEKARQISKKKESAIQNQDFALALELKKLEDEYRDEYEKALLSAYSTDTATVTDEDIKRIISELSGIELTTVKLAVDYDEMETRMTAAVRGQSDAIKALVSAVKRADAGLFDAGRPRGMFLFIGESGVGKTKLARTLASSLFDSESALIRFDMSEFSEAHSVSKLIGAPPGYKGHDEGGMLTEAVRRRPYSVLLFDEIEKADKEVLALFLQIADYGYLSDASGRRVNFRNTYIIMTSNVGADASFTKSSVGFTREENEGAALTARLSKYFKQEFINRFDEILTFSPLTPEVLAEIADMRLSELVSRLKRKGTTLEYSEELAKKIVELSHVRGLGARPILRFIVSHIENPLTDILLSGNASEIFIDVSDKKIRIEEKEKNSLGAPI